MAKLTLSWPSAISRAEMSAETSASVRPTSGISPACSWAATRSAAAPAAAQGGDLGGSLRMRSGPITSTAWRNVVAGMAASRSTRKRAHVWSPIAADDAPEASLATIAIGSSVSSHGSSVNTPGCSTTRGASSRGTTMRGVAVAGHHEHRQALERHRLVAGEVRQVVADRHQQHVDVRARPSPGAPARGGRGRRRWARSRSSVRFSRSTAGELHRADVLGRLTGVVAGAGQRAGLDVADAERLADLAVQRRTRPARPSATTGRWWEVGRRYWPIVTMSTPIAGEVGERADDLVVGLAHPDDQS